METFWGEISRQTVLDSITSFNDPGYVNFLKKVFRSTLKYSFEDSFLNSVNDTKTIVIISYRDNSNIAIASQLINTI